MKGGDEYDDDDVLMGFDEFQKVAMGEDDDDSDENDDYNKRPLSRISTRPWRENTILSSHDPHHPPSSSMMSASHPSTHIPFHDTPSSSYFLYEEDDDDYDDDDQMDEDDDDSDDDDDEESLSFMERVDHIKTMLQCDGITIPRLSRVFGISGDIEEDEFIRRMSEEVIHPSSTVLPLLVQLYYSLMGQDGVVEVGELLTAMCLLSEGLFSEKISAVVQLCYSRGLSQVDFAQMVSLLLRSVGVILQEARLQDPALRSHLSNEITTQLFEEFKVSSSGSIWGDQVGEMMAKMFTAT